MEILGLDFETTGLDPKEDRIIEVGAVSWNWENQVPLAMLSRYIHPNRALPEEIVKITGITDETLDDFGEPESQVWADLMYLVGRADYIMAHFGNDFDRKFYVEANLRNNCECVKPWLDSAQDIKFPPEITTRNLRYLASESGFLNPFAHRAVFDVLTMLKMASKYKIEDIIARSQEPMVYVQAFVSYTENQKAKDFSFRWQPERKIWWKGQKSSDFEADRNGYQFKYAILEKAPE